MLAILRMEKLYDFVDISVDDVNKKCYYVDMTNMDVNDLWV